MNDLTLMARAANGEEDAVGELYDRYGRQVYSLALRMLRDRAAAEDLVQEVFAKLWRDAHRFDPTRGRVGTWILHLAYTKSIDLLRTRGRTTMSSVEPPTQTDLTADTAGAAEARILGQQAREALMRLPAEQRLTLELAYFDAMTQQEISDHLSLPLGTVKSRIRLGLDGLRKLLLSPRRKEVPPHAGMSRS
jgi:RNA polymerase sigma factor (sigma-70 family)